MTAFWRVPLSALNAACTFAAKPVGLGGGTGPGPGVGGGFGPGPGGTGSALVSYFTAPHEMAQMAAARIRTLAPWTRYMANITAAIPATISTSGGMVIGYDLGRRLLFRYTIHRVTIATTATMPTMNVSCGRSCNSSGRKSIKNGTPFVKRPV
jgi:hypothetical protein